MSNDLDPRAGQWYQPQDKGQPFVVIDFDEARGIVEIQHFDGDLESLDLEEWAERPLEMIEEPENWTGPFDQLSAEDTNYAAPDMSDEELNEPLDELADKSAT